MAYEIMFEDGNWVPALYGQDTSRDDIRKSAIYPWREIDELGLVVWEFHPAKKGYSAIEATLAEQMGWTDLTLPKI